MSGRNLFGRCVGIVVLAAFSGVAAQQAPAAQELRYLGWADYVHE